VGGGGGVGGGGLRVNPICLNTTVTAVEANRVKPSSIHLGLRVNPGGVNPNPNPNPWHPSVPTLPTHKLNLDVSLSVPPSSACV